MEGEVVGAEIILVAGQTFKTSDNLTFRFDYVGRARYPHRNLVKVGSSCKRLQGGIRDINHAGYDFAEVLEKTASGFGNPYNFKLIFNPENLKIYGFSRDILRP